MGPTKVAFIFLLATFATSTAFNTVIPHDKEVVYTWEALVRTETQYPARFGSQFLLEGKVHLQADDNATHVKISDLTYKVYNGPLDHVKEHEAHSVPLPQEAQELYHVFRVVYDEHGHVIGIATEKQEREFSRNIKRSIASILQVDHSVIKENHPHAFVVNEHSIYGYGEENYNVMPHEDGIEVHKMHHMHDSHHLYQYFFSNAQHGHCEADFQDPLTHLSTRKYIISKEEGHHVVKSIHAAGVVMYIPFEGKSIAQMMVSQQTFEMEKVVPVQEHLKVKEEHYDDHLSYILLDEKSNNFPDVTNGRGVVDIEKIMPQVKELLQDVHQYLHEDHIHAQEPESKGAQAVNRLKRMLTKFTFEKLKELHETLTGHTLKIYHHILPLVGSKASTLFVKHLVVTKAVDDEEAVAMLQYFPDHIVAPTFELVTELEELIHLKEDIHWSVRKVAILSFANLIHKCHKYSVDVQHRIHHIRDASHHNEGHHDDATHNEGHHDTKDHTHHHSEEEELEKPFEKYVTEYFNKIKNSHDYKEQMTYILAIYNMKLHSTLKHLIPAFNGEWWEDRHLRFISLMAAGSSVLADDSETVFETLWPIMTNQDEHTEMRILAYHYIMESQPTMSRLMNIAYSLADDPNKELHRYHYTYMHSMMHTTDPCRQETRTHFSQLMKIMHPPSHGQSYSQIMDYRDPTYGFSAMIHNYYVKTNASHFFGATFSSQRAHVYHEDFGFYLKIHNGHQLHYEAHTTSIGGLMNIVMKMLPKILSQPDIHIELAIARQNRFINTYFFDKNNMHDLEHVIDLFRKDSHSLIHDLLHISYRRQHMAIIPTDLGTPLVFGQMMPVVHHHNMSLTSETANKVLNIHVHNRHAIWIHHREGLSFYNPIADVWQGIHRYHTFDTVLPLHLDIALNMQQQSLQISWKKSDDPLMNVAGMRAHSKQMTFVEDMYHRNILGQSSPHSKEWMVVTNGKEYRNEYPLLEEDDVNTGTKWYVGKFDCGHHVSNGSFGHKMHMFLQTNTKNFDSPIDHLLLSYFNFYHFGVLTPRDGTCGLVVRAEPSHEHVVSNIDLSVRLHQETIDEPDFHYTPGKKVSARLTYAVKNKEQSLKTWDVNAIVDMNPGHTVNSLKLQLTRIIPGQKDYKVCMEGVKKWTLKGVTGHLNVAMSQTPDGKCAKDDAVVDVTMTGKRSHAQEHEHHLYGTCAYPVPYFMRHLHLLQCMASRTSVRQYVYNVKTTNVPTEFKKTFSRWWDYVKGHYMPYYTYEDEHDQDIGEHNFKVDMVYPMQEKVVDVHVTTPHHVYGLTGVPTEYWREWGLRPDSLAYSHGFMHAHEAGHVDHCVVHDDHHQLNRHHEVKKAPGNEWTLYVGDAEENPKEAVYVKHMGEEKIGVKVVDHEHSFEIVPHGDDHQITIDGKVVPIEEEYHYEDWVSFVVLHHDVDHPVLAMLKMSGFHVEYDGHHVIVVVPEEEDHQWHGVCYAQH